MAISVDNLIVAMRIGNTTPEREIATRLLASATAYVENAAPDAPDAIKEEAIIRLAAYWYDMPNAPMGTAFASAFRNSGAKSLLLPFREYKTAVAG